MDLNDRPNEDGMSCIEYLRHFERHLTEDEWRLLMALRDDSSRCVGEATVASVSQAVPHLIFGDALGHIRLGGPCQLVGAGVWSD